LRVVQEVGALEDHTKTALSDLLADPVVHADDIGARGSHRVVGGSRRWLLTASLLGTVEYHRRLEGRCKTSTGE